MGLLEEGKSLLALANSIQNRELHEKLSSYLDKVYDLTADKLILQEQIADLKRDNTELQESLKFKANLKRVGEAYQVLDDPKRFICMKCWEKDKLSMTLFQRGSNWWCATCQRSFGRGGHFSEE